MSDSPDTDPNQPATPQEVVLEISQETLTPAASPELNETQPEAASPNSEGATESSKSEPSESASIESDVTQGNSEETVPSDSSQPEPVPPEPVPFETTPSEPALPEPTPPKPAPEGNPPKEIVHTATKKEDITPQSHVSWQVFIIGQSLCLFIILGGIFWLDQKVKKSTSAPSATSAPANVTPAPDNNEVAALQANLSRAQDQITTLQRQIDAQRAERDGTQARLQEMADRMALVIKQTSFVPTADSQNLGTGDAAQVAAMLPSVSPATSELILLKERNRLTDYADKAIATGTRQSLQAIVDAMFDPALKHLRHASEAEFRRVQAYFEISSSIDPTFKLPLQELFKDAAVRSEADLTPAQLTTLLTDAKQPWEVRLRCAYLLRASTDAGTNAALLKVIKDDPSLDVVKQAQTTFEKRVGQRFRLFDIPSIEAWWGTQKTQ